MNCIDHQKVLSLKDETKMFYCSQRQSTANMPSYNNQTAHSSVQNRQQQSAAATTSSSNPDTQIRGRGSSSSFQTTTGYSTAHQVAENY